jgi:hypothetical protein
MANDLVPVLHPIDRALAAISDAMSDVLVGGKSSRFAEVVALARIAHKLQQRRHVTSLDEVNNGDVGGVDVNVAGVVDPNRILHVPRFNDGADISREILMLVQGFLKNYMEVEHRKVSKPALDTRLNEVMELAELTALRIRMLKDDEQVPDQVDQRITHLLQRIGEPSHAPQPDHVSAFSAEPLRGHPPNGAGEPNRDRVGEPVAE